jgi:hypothetical protein
VYATGPYSAEEAERIADSLGSIVIGELGYRQMLAAKMLAPTASHDFPEQLSAAVA